MARDEHTKLEIRDDGKLAKGSKQKGTPKTQKTALLPVGSAYVDKDSFLPKGSRLEDIVGW